MKIIEEFISDLNKLNINLELYKKKGYTSEEIEDFLFACNPIFKRAYPNNLLEDPILYFLYCYDSNLDSITFFNVDYEFSLYNKNYYRIGDFDDMPICINIISHEVVMLNEHGDINLFCCSDTSNFLNVILNAVPFYIDLDLIDDEINYMRYGKDLAKKCSELAGGDKYLPFYELMFCLDE